MSLAVPAAGLVVTGACNPKCLLATDAECACRCGGRFHALLASVPIDIDPARTPVIIRGEQSAPRRPAPRPSAPVNDDDLHRAALAANAQAVAQYGRPLSVRALRKKFRIGQPRAIELRDWLARHAAP